VVLCRLTRRKQKRNVLAVSVLSILIVDAGLVPQRISALGVEFSQTDKATILRILFAANVYFAFAFLIYALADFSAWRAEIRWSQRELVDKIIESLGEKQRINLDYYEVAWGKRYEPVRIIMLADIKAVFDLAGALPPVVYAAMRLLGLNFSWPTMGVPGILYLAGILGYVATRYRRLKRRTDRQRH